MVMAHSAAKAASLVPIVDAEFEALIPPLQPEERTDLEKSILREGCRDALVVWKEKGILLDGHNRFAICKLHGRPYRVVEQSFADRDDAMLWMLRNQLGRRNLQPIERIGILSSVEKIVAEKAKRNEIAGGGDKVSAEARAGLVKLPNPVPAAPAVSEHDKRTITAQERPKAVPAEKPKPIVPIDTRAEMAKMAGVSEKTYDAGKKVLATGTPKLVQAVQSGAASISAAAIVAALPAAKQDEIVAKGEKAIIAAAGDIKREQKREQVIAKLEDVRTREVKAAAGVYDVLVIDPPWDMQKIERDVRPNQAEFDYPTMSDAQLAELKLPMADDAHVWVWTTHKFLPMALRLLEVWKLKYVCTFVWHKPGGFQPIGLPQYNCEFAIYARKGAPQFIDTKALPTCFTAPRGAHSEKPEEFYDVVRRVTAGRRIDIFNRREIAGFDRWGNEV